LSIFLITTAKGIPVGAISDIEWTEATWNPLTGCTKISPGCLNCYAERLAKRLQAMGNANYYNGFKLTIHEHALELPLSWHKAKLIFVNSMSDLFHPDVPTSFIRRVFLTMGRAHWHYFQVLTKRSERLLELNSVLPWAPNIWMGVSVENQDYSFRIEHLRQTGASIKFVSFEPLLSALSNLDLNGIDWVIAGGESGPGARLIKPSWIRYIRNRCLYLGIPFFFKQWGGVNRKKAGRLLDGRAFNEMPLLTPAFPS
jgi:protein gp37